MRFALLFGTTWFVNALVFAGILLSVLAAIEVSRRVTIRRPLRLYAALMAALLVAWLVRPSTLLSLSALPRFGVATLVAFLPVFLANRHCIVLPAFSPFARGYDIICGLPSELISCFGGEEIEVYAHPTG